MNIFFIVFIILIIDSCIYVGIHVDSLVGLYMFLVACFVFNLVTCKLPTNDDEDL